jgi:hypothetical protein
MRCAGLTGKINWINHNSGCRAVVAPDITVPVSEAARAVLVWPEGRTGAASEAGRLRQMMRFLGQATVVSALIVDTGIAMSGEFPVI